MSGARKMVDVYNHVKHCTTHPKFLHSNSTSHRWVFGAIAELIDNAIDPDVSASQFCIDMKEFHGIPCLVFMDNGCGLVPEKLHKMLSFGHSKKQMSPGDRSIGKHGNGFKSGTMRLGKDVLVLTKCADNMTAGFLSQTFLADTGAEDILIPQVSWDLFGNRLCPFDLEIEESLKAICKYSIFPDEDSLLAQLEAIPVTGTILIISNLRKHEGVLELDFETDLHDIRIAAEINSSQFQQLRPNQPNTTEVPMDYSLRAYVAILYKVPRMQVFIRDKKVKTKRIAGILSLKETEYYKPVGVAEQIKIELGFNTENKNLYGMMLYHRNRLIKAYMRVGMQLEENERGMGVIGLAEADFLQPTHNKQDFDDTTAYRRLLKKLADVLAEYWWEKKERVPEPQHQLDCYADTSPVNLSTSEDVPDVIWVQCDNPICLKWRILPPGTDVSLLPDIWYCEYHPDEKYRIHEEPEQEWDPSAKHEIIERRKERKREYDREKKEREAERKRQRLEAASKDNHVLLQKQREALEKEVQLQAAKGDLAQKEYAVLLAERSEIVRKHKETMRELEKAQTELSRKEKEKDDAARSSSQQSQPKEPREGSRSRNASLANGHSADEQQDEWGNTVVDDSRSFREEAAGMRRVRVPIRAVSASANVSQQSARSNGDLHSHEARGSPSRDALGSSRRSAAAAAKKSAAQEIAAARQRPREVQLSAMASQPQNAQTPPTVLPPRVARGTPAAAEDPQQSHRRARHGMSSGVGSSSSAQGNVNGLQGASAEISRRRRVVIRGSPAASQGATAAGVKAAPTRELQNSSRQSNRPFGDALPGAVTPPTPSPGCPPSLNPQAMTPGSVEPCSFLLAAAQQMCQLNQQPTEEGLVDPHRSAGSADPAQRDLLSAPPPLAANGGSGELRRGDIFMEDEGVDYGPQSPEHTATAQVISLDNGAAPSSGTRLGPPQGEGNVSFGSGMLAVHLPLDSVAHTSNSRSETELTQAFFKSQRQFRLMINTLHKIGGSGGFGLVELDGLPTEDNEVVAICEKATEKVETIVQDSRQEVAKLKAELAYLMADNMQHGQGEQARNFKIQSIANQWGMDVSK